MRFPDFADGGFVIPIVGAGFLRILFGRLGMGGIASAGMKNPGTYSLSAGIFVSFSEGG